MADKKDVVIYGADWCGDTLRTKHQLDGAGIDYTYINIDEDAEGEQKVIAFNNGKRRIPLVEVGAESLSVPSVDDLKRLL